MENFVTDSCMERELTSGLMEINMTVNIKIMLDMVKVSTYIPTVVHTTVNGKMEENMDQEF